MIESVTPLSGVPFLGGTNVSKGIPLLGGTNLPSLEVVMSLFVYHFLGMSMFFGDILFLGAPILQEMF